MTQRFALLLVLAAACTQPLGPPQLSRVTSSTHPFFPIDPVLDGGHSMGKGSALDGPVTCESCHLSSAASFKDVTCTGCHIHELPIDVMLHRSVADAGVSGPACVACHPRGEPVPYDHAQIVSGECATCHEIAHAFAALPLPGFTHRTTGGTDCGACHVTRSWKEVSAAPDGVFDPDKSVTVNTLIPTFSGPTITTVRPAMETLQMRMKHTNSVIDGGVMQNCIGCHTEAGSNVYYPGLLHSSLAELGAPQPARCVECHQPTGQQTNRPTGFVGEISVARDPSSGPMRHEAVSWMNGMPTTTPLVTADCVMCHVPPGRNRTQDWTTGFDGGVRFHAALAQASAPQPSSCLDCHANSRPKGLLTSMNAAVPAGLTFDHQSALGDCGTCHQSFVTWAGGISHPAGSTTPSTCLPCHAQERPRSTAGWSSPGWQDRPFDFAGNDAGVTHGAGEDCSICHSGPGSGMWGGTQNWQRGHFPHGPNTIAATTCLTCHLSQRPDNLPNGVNLATAIGFDHAVNGTGDCVACHQATVRANRYQNLYNPTGTLPGGDWTGGASYPGDFLITSPSQFITLTTYQLQRATPQSLITGVTSRSVTLPNAMKHTSSAIPAQVFPGTAANPDNSTCWHCHVHSNGTVTAYANGVFHSALTNFRSQPNGGVAMPLPQPSSGCRDCHAQMLPPDLVQRSGGSLFPMDHRTRFTAPVQIGGMSVSSADSMDCSRCHRTAGTAWADGQFHSTIASATPQDCQSCHYPLMALPASDVTTGTRFAMKHRSVQVTTQNCQACHSMALSRATTTPAAAPLWNPGAFHSSLTTQPARCLDCHANTDPTTATQGTVVYNLVQGSTATNGGQWMNHTAAAVVASDCSVCHAQDARSSGAAWNKGTAFHSRAPNVTQCSICHGTSNGRGTAPGTNNNLPSIPTDTRTPTSSSVNPALKAQMNHADINANKDCNFCHSQVGPSAQGKEWAQASFHSKFTVATPLVTNGSTGRCSNCHINEKPGATFTRFDHAPYSSSTTTPDCSTCHAYPGSSTPPTPNWRGAAAVPAYISVGGFTIPVPPATTSGTTQRGIANLPHPTVASGVACTVCHTQASGGRRAFGFPHTSSLINTNCNSCHEAGSDLLGTPWNGATSVSAGAGDTRPFTLPSVVPSFDGNTRACAYPKHFFPIDCKECHRVPSGNGTVTTGTAYRTAWRFQHTTSRMTRPGTCNTCHSGVCNIPD